MKQIIRNKARLSRRTFMVGSAAAGSGLALGFNLPDGSDIGTGAERSPTVAPRSMPGSSSNRTIPA